MSFYTSASKLQQTIFVWTFTNGTYIDAQPFSNYFEGGSWGCEEIYRGVNFCAL